MPELGFPRRIFYSEPAPEALASLARLWGARRVLVVSDPIISGLEAYRSIVEALRSAGVEVVEYTRVAPEPPMEQALEAAELAGGVDIVVAVGGGSVIDVAKAATVIAKRPGMSVEDIAPFNPLGVEFERPLLVAVPTTAGTGSDASYGIVLSKLEGGVKVKVAVGSYEVVPHATILDPEIPTNAPERIRKGALADALSHALEALISTNSNPLSDALAEKAATIILTLAPQALLNGDREAWAKIHLAATMAGIAFSNSGLGLAHALAHPLGAILGVHHGTTVGIILPEVLGLAWERSEEARAKMVALQRVLEHVHGLPAKPTLREHILALYEAIGFPTRFSVLGIGEEDYRKAARLAAERAYHDPDIAFSPVIPSTEELESLLLSLY